MIGTRPPPTSSASQRYGSGFHGSPVDPNSARIERSTERWCSSPAERSARTSVGETPRNVEPVICDESPEPAGIGEVGRAVELQDAAAQSMRPDQQPRPHDPAEIGRPVDAIVRPEVSDVGGLGGELDEQPAVDVHGALRPAGRARGVAEQDRMLAVDGDRPPLAGSIGDEIVVPRRRGLPATARPRRAGGGRRRAGAPEPRQRPCPRSPSPEPAAAPGKRVPQVMRHVAPGVDQPACHGGSREPEKIGTASAPSEATAYRAAAASGTIGRSRATRLPGGRRGRARPSATRAVSRASSAYVQRRVTPSSPSQATASRLACADRRRSARRRHGPG